MNLTKLTAKLQPLVAYIKRYRIIVFALFFLGLYSFLIFQINALAESEPDPAMVSESTVKRLQVDQKSIDNILKLEEQNIEVKSLFQEARANPFTE